MVEEEEEIKRRNMECGCTAWMAARKELMMLTGGIKQSYRTRLALYKHYILYIYCVYIHICTYN